MSRPPTNPNTNDAKGISELVDEVERILKEAGYVPQSRVQAIDGSYSYDPILPPLLKALHKAVDEQVIGKDEKLYDSTFNMSEAEVALMDGEILGRNKLRAKQRRTLNALLQPYKLRSQK